VGVRGSTKKHLKYCFYCNPSSAAFPASAPSHSDIFIDDGVPQGGRSGQRATFGRHSYFYIEERERHPVVYDLCKAVRDGTFSPLVRGEGIFGAKM
jgi:hypothetical protein